MATRAKRVIRYGNHFYRSITCPGAGKPLAASYWDLWMAIALTTEFDGDWDRMTDYLRSKRKSRLHWRGWRKRTRTS